MLFKLLYLTIIPSSICRDDCLSVAAHIYVKSLLYFTNCTLATVKFELLLLLLLYNYSVQICRTEMLWAVWPHPHMAMILWLSSCEALARRCPFSLTSCIAHKRHHNLGAQRNFFGSKRCALGSGINFFWRCNYISTVDFKCV